jgi:hypothetical protein
MPHSTLAVRVPLRSPWRSVKVPPSGDGWLRARLRRHCVEAAWLAIPARGQDCWIKVKNPEAPAVRREAEEDWV